MSGIRYTQEQYEQLIRDMRTPKMPDRSAVPVANMEPNPSDGPTPADASEKVCPRFRIQYHSRRRRLCDPDGLYSKAATDGLTVGGVLPDDNAAIVESVTYSQSLVPKIGGIEETIIEVWEIVE